MHVDENVILEKTKGKKEERNDLSVDFVDEGKGGGKLIIFDRSTNGVIARFDKKKNNSGYT